MQLAVEAGAKRILIPSDNKRDVEMIEKHYAAHPKDMIDTSLVNVRREKPKRRGHDESDQRPEA